MRRLVFVALFSLACFRDPVSEQRTNNSNFSVEELFTHNGCTIYRFVDGGRHRYWTDCRGSVSNHYSQYNGKTTYDYEDSIQTVR